MLGIGDFLVSKRQNQQELARVGMKWGSNRQLLCLQRTKVGIVGMNGRKCFRMSTDMGVGRKNRRDRARSPSSDSPMIHILAFDPRAITAMSAITRDLFAIAQGVLRFLQRSSGVLYLDSPGIAGLPWVGNRHIIRVLWQSLFDQDGKKVVGLR
jgi:hypothetical protein